VNIVAGVLVGLVAALHLYFMVLEMFLWTAPRTRAAFGTTEEFATASKTLAANQGLYNGFLAAGLVWGLIDHNFAFQVFFLCCVIVAGIYGAATASRRILFVQAVPGALALAAVLIAH
jgi:putative membrane protein